MSPLLALAFLQKAPHVVLRVGQGVDFSTGKVARGKGDLFLRVQKEGSTSGARLNVATGQMEYQAGVTTSPAPSLAAARVGTFERGLRMEEIDRKKIDGWTKARSDFRKDAFMVVRALTTGRHYVLRIDEFVMPKADPATWRVGFTYKPLDVP